MTPDGVELTAQPEDKQSQQSLLIMDWEPTLGAIRTRQDIARAEFRKQRKRLGVLSAEQETAIEALLMTTVNKVSLRAVAQMRRLIETHGLRSFRFAPIHNNSRLSIGLSGSRHETKRARSEWTGRCLRRSEKRNK